MRRREFHQVVDGMHNWIEIAARQQSRLLLQRWIHRLGSGDSSHQARAAYPDDAPPNAQRRLVAGFGPAEAMITTSQIH